MGRLLYVGSFPGGVVEAFLITGGRRVLSKKKLKPNGEEDIDFSFRVRDDLTPEAFSEALYTLICGNSEGPVKTGKSPVEKMRGRFWGYSPP